MSNCLILIPQNKTLFCHCFIYIFSKYLIFSPIPSEFLFAKQEVDQLRHHQKKLRDERDVSINCSNYWLFETSKLQKSLVRDKRDVYISRIYIIIWYI